MLKIRPPTHRVDAQGTFISREDCWDHEAIDKEAQTHVAKALEEKKAAIREKYPEASPEDLQVMLDGCELTDAEKKAALQHSPWLRYYYGKTRFQIDAPEIDGWGKSMVVRSYLKEGGTPTLFMIRRLPYQLYRDVEDLDWRKQLLEFVALGLREIRNTGTGFNWRSEGDRVPEAVLEALHNTSLTLINEIGAAVRAFNAPLGDEEGKL